MSAAELDPVAVVLLQPLSEEREPFLSMEPGGLR